jgi:hypothetical protein
LTDYAFPDLIGYIDSKTSRNITYVGHSNGGRVAISSLDRWGNSGRQFNSSSLYDMSSRPIRHLIGVGVPGAFEGQGNAFANMLASKGSEILNNNKTHLTLKEVAYFILFNVSRKDTENRISQNLFYNYYEFAKNSYDLQPGVNTSLERFDIIYSGIGMPTTSIILYSNDEIVDNVDEELIYGNINSSDKNRYFLMNKIHTDMPSDKEIQERIKERLKYE